MAWLLHQGNVRGDWLVVEVDLYHGYTMNRQVGQLINADIAPLACDKSHDIPKGLACFGIVLGQIPSAWSKCVE
jgi:hypothetical protein